MSKLSVDTGARRHSALHLPLQGLSLRDEDFGHTSKVGAISPRKGFFVNEEAKEDNKFIDENYTSLKRKESTL